MSAGAMFCDFCASPAAAVTKLIASSVPLPTGGSAAICDGCVRQCVEVLAQAEKAADAK